MSTGGSRPLGERHLVRTAMECGLVWMKTDGCFYFNVEREQTCASTMWHCDLTSTLVSFGKEGQPNIVSEDWDAYTIM